MSLLNINTLYFDFFKNKPFVSLLSFILIIFYVGITIFFPRYSGTFISNMFSLNKKQFINQLIILCCVYIALWVGVCLHHYVTHSILIKSARAFFIEKIFLPLWNKIEEGKIKKNSTSKILKSTLTVVLSSTLTVQNSVFNLFPIFFSVIVFILYIPNIFEVKCVVIFTFILIFYIIYIFYIKLQNVSGERSLKTNEIIDLLEDDINNSLNIINFNTLKKELKYLKMNCQEQEKKCYDNEMTIVNLTRLFLIIIIIGLMSPILMCYRKQNLNEYKIFVASYIPMIISIILICYTSLTRIINFAQGFGDQKKNIDIINSFIIETNSKKKKKYFSNDNNLNLININLSFGKNIIFKNLNLQFNKGITLLKGNSGGGKTCIFNIIFGLLIPNDGDVFYKQISKNNISITEWRTNIFYINQFPLFFNNRNIHENIYYGNCNKKLCNVDKINNTIQRFGLSEKFDYLLKNSASDSLSGGEKQIISIIRSFATNKDIYLFDEPTASLDAKKKHIFYEIIKELKKMNKTIIVISHDRHFEEISDEILDIDIIKEKHKLHSRV